MMGTFTVAFEVGNHAGTKFVPVEALVDTGSTYTSLPADLLRSLEIEPQETRGFRLADDEYAEYPVGQARVRIGGQDYFVVVVFTEPGVQPLLGATTLETFSLAADPIGQELVRVDALRKQRRE